MIQREYVSPVRYFAYVRDEKINPGIGGGGKVIHVYPSGPEDETASAVAVDTGRSIVFRPDKLNPDVIFVAEGFRGMSEELDKRGWLDKPWVKPAPSAPKAEVEVEEPEAEVEEPEVDEPEPVTPIPHTLITGTGGVGKTSLADMIEVETPAPTVEKKVEKPVDASAPACHACGSQVRSRNGRGFVHVVGCPESTAVKYPHTLKRKRH